MEKLSKILALILAGIIVLNIGVFATDTDDTAETTTEVVTEESTTEAPSEDTTTEAAEEETTTEVNTEESTTDAPSEETTTEAAEEEETTTEVATEESTTDVPSEETTTEAEAETTTEVNTEESTTDASSEETTTEAEEEEEEETTTEVNTEESTTDAPSEETTTEVEEETTTEVNTEESTTEAPSEETTTEVEEETTTEVSEETTTEVEEESTTVPEEEPTTTPDDITTTTPEATEPTEPTEPEVTEPTEPEKPEVELPAAPANIKAGAFKNGSVSVSWDTVEGATGYDVYLKSGENWVYQSSVTKTKCTLKNALYNSKYVMGIKTYVIVDGEKYESAEMAEYTVVTGADIPETKFTLSASSDTVTLKWDSIKGASGYRVYIKQDGKWVKLTSTSESTYTYKKALPGKTYKFAIKPYSKGTEGTKFGKLQTAKIVIEDYSKTVVKATDKTTSTISLKWNKIKNASGYRVYIHKNGKWVYYKGITKNTYTIKGLKDATNYKIKVKAHFKVDGKVNWGTYSDTITVATEGKAVKAKYISKLKKYFTDGDWCITLGGLKDDMGFNYTMTLAAKGDDIYVKYDYKESLISDFAYLIQMKKEKVYFIRYKAKTYERLPEDEAVETAITYAAFAMIFDMESAKGVKAKNALYGGKAAIAEIYTDKTLDIKKTYYFVGDSLKALKLTYTDGSTETFKSIKITDTPSASYFKLPSGYKDFTV